MPEINFGLFVQEKRASTKGTVLAKKTGISAAYLLDIEKGARKAPAYSIQIKLAQALNLDKEDSRKLFDLAAKERNEIPADVWYFLLKHEEYYSQIRVTFDCEFMIFEEE